MVVNARGPVPPLPGGIAGALVTSASATVQVHRTDGPGCVSAILDQLVEQESHRFKAK